MIKVFLWRKVSWTGFDTHKQTQTTHSPPPHTHTHKLGKLNSMWMVLRGLVVYQDWSLCINVFIFRCKQTNKPIIFCKIVPACEPFLTSAASFWTPQRGRLIPLACLYVNFVLHILNLFGCRNASVGNIFCNKRFFPIKPILENVHSGLLFRPGAIACILNRAQCRVLISSTRGLRDRWLSREEGTDTLSRLHLPPTLCPRVEGSL